MLDVATDFNYTQLDPTLDELLARFAALGNVAGDGAETVRRRYGKAVETPYWHYFFMPAVDELARVPRAAKRLWVSQRLLARFCGKVGSGKRPRYVRIEYVWGHVF